MGLDEAVIERMVALAAVEGDPTPDANPELGSAVEQAAIDCGAQRIT